MKKTFKSCVIAFLVVSFCLIFNQVSAESNLMKMGRDYKASRQWKEAVNTLNKEIHVRPKNAEAHYLLGYCYNKLGDTYEANERYKSAIDLTLQNTGKASRAFFYLDTDQINGIRPVIDETIKKNPAIKKELAGQIFDYGEERLKANEVTEANTLFNLAISYDRNLIYKACDLYFKLGLISDQSTLDYSLYTRNYCSGNKQRMEKIGERILKVAANTPKGDCRNNLKERALWFLPQPRIDEVIPPPWWQTVAEKNFIGRGLGEDDWLPVADFGTDIKIGYRYVIKGDHFEVYNNGAWRAYNNECTLTNRTGTTGSLGVKAEPGVEISLSIERFIE